MVHDAFDRVVRARFLVVHEAAAAGQLADWQETREGALALVFLFDRFPRNMFRGEARAFATDAMGRGVTDLALARGYRFGDAAVLLSAVYAFGGARRPGSLRSPSPQSADLNKTFSLIKPGGKSGEFVARAFARPWLSGWPHPKP